MCSCMLPIDTASGQSDTQPRLHELAEHTPLLPASASAVRVPAVDSVPRGRTSSPKKATPPHTYVCATIVQVKLTQDGHIGYNVAQMLSRQRESIPSYHLSRSQWCALSVHNAQRRVHQLSVNHALLRRGETKCGEDPRRGWRQRTATLSEVLVRSIRTHGLLLTLHLCHLQQILCIGRPLMSPSPPGVQASHEGRQQQEQREKRHRGQRLAIARGHEWRRSERRRSE